MRNIWRGERWAGPGRPIRHAQAGGQRSREEPGRTRAGPGRAFPDWALALLRDDRGREGGGPPSAGSLPIALWKVRRQTSSGDCAHQTQNSQLRPLEEGPPRAPQRPQPEPLVLLWELMGIPGSPGGSPSSPGFLTPLSPLALSSPFSFPADQKIFYCI